MSGKMIIFSVTCPICGDKISEPSKALLKKTATKKGWIFGSHDDSKVSHICDCPKQCIGTAIAECPCSDCHELKKTKGHPDCACEMAGPEPGKHCEYCPSFKICEPSRGETA